jgi:hypothetical protein
MAKAQKCPQKPEIAGKGPELKIDPARLEPWNPYMRRVAELRRAFMNAISKEDIQAIVARLLADAKKGNQAAAKLVLQYGLGTPTPAPNPDRGDRDEYERAQERPRYRDLRDDLDRVPFRVAKGLNVLMEPVQQERVLKLMEPGKAPDPAAAPATLART